jgi:hypothetical protein
MEKTSNITHTWGGGQIGIILKTELGKYEMNTSLE